MTKLEDLKARVRAVLEDPASSRFSSSLLDAAFRQSLDRMDQHLPSIAETNVTAAASGCEIPLSSLTNCHCIIDVILQGQDPTSRILEPDLHFTCFIKDGIPTLYFNGKYIPQAGDTLVIRYASGYIIEGLAGELSTTLPETFESTLVSGAAAEACFLRAAATAEQYGIHPAETSRLMEIGHLWRENFIHALSGLKTLQDFGFPTGFALDRWDGRNT